jgi:hypothetical protein
MKTDKQQLHLVVNKNIIKMKNIITIIIIIFSVIQVDAQEPIRPMYNSPIELTSGSYSKDLDNDLNPFIGEWKWEEGNNSLTIQFQKIEMYHNNSNQYFNDYEDELVGDYKYIENGVEVINTLPLNFTGDKYDNQIRGAIITTLNRGFPPCDECAPNTRFILLYFKEPENPQLQGKIRMAHFVESGIEKIRMRITLTFITNLTAEYSGPEEFKVPEGIYTFIKQ